MKVEDVPSTIRLVGVVGKFGKLKVGGAGDTIACGVNKGSA
jgi:hypothetical protein